MTSGDYSDVIKTFVFYSGALVWIILNKFFGLSLTICPSKLLFHIPCPGCGMTRATCLLLDGKFIESFTLNPNALLLLPFIIAFPFLLYIRIKTKKDYINKILGYVELKAVYIPLGCFEVLIWIHNIHCGL
ncbi:MAG: DUF2752 domain-containing protein [Muribaculaceae bacterium]